MTLRKACQLFCLLPALTIAFAAGDHTASLKTGKAELKSAGTLAFGPDAILFVGDSLGAAVYALDTGDRAGAAAGPVDIRGINQKIAALLGTAPDQILIQDVAVNPISRRVYLSVARGRTPDAPPIILRTAAGGKLEEFALDNVPHARVGLPNAPDPNLKDRRGGSPRLEAITDLAYVDGTVFIAGLSNEEFASKLRAIPFPFREADGGASVEIYHGSHGRFETNAPVRTFVPYRIKKEPHILAAYTCTPLVRFPVSALKPGAKVVGTTIAELGNRNRPLDMIVYQRGGRDYILMTNSSRGVMKMSTEKIDAIPAITQPTEMAGLPFETLESLKGVHQLDAYDRESAVVLMAGDSGSLDLKTIALP
jgi:hypothetical protein